RQRRLPRLPPERGRLVPPDRHGPVDGGSRSHARTAGCRLRPRFVPPPLPGIPQGPPLLAPRTPPRRPALGSRFERLPAQICRRLRPPFTDLPGCGGRLPGGVATDLVLGKETVGHVAGLRPAGSRRVRARRAGKLPVLPRR